MSAALSDTEFAVIDVETTGLNPNRYDRVIEIAIVRLMSGGLRVSPWHEVSAERSLLFTWTGSRTQRTIVLLSRLAGVESIDRQVAVEFSAPERVARHKLVAVLRKGVTGDALADQEECQARRKYDGYLPKELLRRSFIADGLNVARCMSILDEASTGKRDSDDREF